ncbi:Ubiquitin-like-conjugating enzyme ATG3 [Smittium culicis]|uniref:Autophagy-related protein 3 n=1 Tax=Smittium culicis TaxID=133412 RepID=A0A1R1WZJ9_9FUNG|nr:Ubiquitin-like-conjugating enzyme ATG3 [Smittium culicis]OMJ11273.1 Ubiquitin-like-conjugating enzyme ATG3 [Smittium culicis]
MSTFNSLFHGVREYLNPILKNSKFKETGVLTPEEFVAAGDYLVFKCPTWHWEPSVKGKNKDYLPADKQFLITKNIPCLKRVSQIELGAEAEAQDGEWVNTYANHVSENLSEIQDISEIHDFPDTSISSNASQLTDDIPDIDDYCQIESDGEELDLSKNSNILKTRTYDISITYDKYYQTPRVWLCGYSENGSLLSPNEIFQDISQDHARKTVTIEPHPNLSIQLASIHPCKHANVMKKIIERSTSNGHRELRVDQYLIIFLKFISTVLPTIEYDYTMSTDF